MALDLADVQDALFLKTSSQLLKLLHTRCCLLSISALVKLYLAMNVEVFLSSLACSLFSTRKTANL